MLVENIADVFMEHIKPGLLSSLVLNVEATCPYGCGVSVDSLLSM